MFSKKKNSNSQEDAKKAPGLFKDCNLPMSPKAKKYEKDIRELTE